MSRSPTTEQKLSPAEGKGKGVGDQSKERKDNELCILVDHGCPTAETMSQMASSRSGYGLAWLLLHFINMGRSKLPFEKLDLVDFSLNARKLKLLLASFLSGPGILETLKFNCDLSDTASGIFDLLPSSLEHVDLSGNRLRCQCMEAVSSALSSGGLPKLLSLDLSDNPLRPSGVRALAKCLSSSKVPLPLQSLKLARTKAKAEGVETLAEALKAKKTTSLQTLDLAENEMRPAGLKHLASAINAEAVPRLRVLILKLNYLTLVAGDNRDYVPTTDTDYGPIAEFLSTSALKELEEFDLGGNHIFDREIGVGEGGWVSAAAFGTANRFPGLRRLNLGGSDSQMLPRQLKVFATALGVKGAPSLEEVVIPREGYPDTPGGVVALANALSSGHLSQLRSLKIANRRDIKSDAFAKLCRSLTTGKTSSLQTLELNTLSCKDVVDDGLWALAEGIGEGGLSSLKSLRLSFSPVEGVALSSLGLALGRGGCRCLQELHLSWYEHGGTGLQGLAEGLGGGCLLCLRDLSVCVRFMQEYMMQGRSRREYKWEPRGCKALGEVLSTGKVPSLRTVSLNWLCGYSFASVCDGLSKGRISPGVMVEVELRRGIQEYEDFGMTRFAKVIRQGKLSGLRKLRTGEHFWLSRQGGGVLGEALTHADAPLKSLEEVTLSGQKYPAVEAFLARLCRGPGSLPALRSLECPEFGWGQAPQFTRSLSAFITGGKVPSLRDLKVDVAGVGQEAMQAFAAALHSPHVFALRRLEVRFGGVSYVNAAADVGMVSVAMSSGNLRRLEELCVGNFREIEEVRALCVGLGSGRLSSLRKLQFLETSLGVEGGRALSEVLVAEKLPLLRSLVAASTELTDGGVWALTEGWMIRSPPPLEDLNLDSNGLTEAAADALLTLQSSKRMPLLETLSVVDNDPFDEGLKCLLSAAFAEVRYVEEYTPWVAHTDFG
uniref:Uncharacterized protein n=1 Tax=Chromera velia CCMP2878 TaxID=1169474 RepID=A0A0G4HQR0_9ALVE|eukprot:Cvel_30234.t1-p1 / transcript=Cvel_30234.t1 / gene=Cvel_30234 / organism=Chromera_velia_CCMP2878 / gene_product=hypothetical protein / transcript_product=hypothetical protein / location=Cvel_scaffold4283:4951-9436(+) / protein_length=945 / sequence_SO=supercontig / SO=protein_coding / is_pseudo=false